MKSKNIFDNILQTGIFLLIVLVPLMFDNSRFHYKLLTMQFIVVFSLLILSIKAYKNNVKISFNILLLPIFLYFSAIVYSYFISNYKDISFLVLTKRLTYLSIFFIIAYSIQKDKLSKIINIWIFIATIVSVYGIIQYFGFDFLNLYKNWYKGYYRIFSTIGNPNFLAGYLVITFPFLISCFIYARKRSKKFLISISGIFLLMCLILTFSRSGYLVFFITLFVYVFLFMVARKKRRYLFLFISVVLIFITLSILFLNSSPLLQSKLSFLLERKTARYYIWKGAVNIIKEKPLKGFGLGAFVVNFPDFRSNELLNFHPQNVAYIKHAHNYFLETWVESGILGFLSFAILVLIFLFFGFRLIFTKEDIFYVKMLNISVISSLIGMLCMNLVNVNMHYATEGMFFWILLGIIYILSTERFDLKTIFLPKINIIFMTTFILIFLLILKAIIFSLPYMKIKNQVVKLYSDQISDYFYNNKSDLAISNYKNIIKENIADDKIYYNLGAIYFLKGYIKNAVIQMERAILVNPDNQKAKYLLYRLAK